MNPLLSQFLSESREFSENIGDKLMQLERTPEDQNTVNELFRLVHTLKGNSGLFTFPEMTRVLHAGEDLLGLVRNGQLAYSRELADRLLDGIDLVMVMCGDIESTEKIDASRAQDSARMVEALRVLLPSAPDLPVSDGADVSGSSSTVAALSQMKLPLLEEIPEATRLDAFHRRGIGEQVYWIAYTPARECFFQGDDPFYLARQVPGILWGTTQPSGPLPALAELDTDSRVAYGKQDILAGLDKKMLLSIGFVDFDIRGLEGNFAALRHCVASIDRQVHEHLLDLVGVDFDRIQIGTKDHPC
jgi:two-component system chemotaxis sensor kinase CheA